MMVAGSREPWLAPPAVLRRIAEMRAAGGHRAAEMLLDAVGAGRAAHEVAGIAAALDTAGDTADADRLLAAACRRPAAEFAALLTVLADLRHRSVLTGAHEAAATLAAADIAAIAALLEPADRDALLAGVTEARSDRPDELIDLFGTLSGAAAPEAMLSGAMLERAAARVPVSGAAALADTLRRAGRVVEADHLISRVAGRCRDVAEFLDLLGSVTVDEVIAAAVTRRDPGDVAAILTHLEAADSSAAAELADAMLDAGPAMTAQVLSGLGDVPLRRFLHRLAVRPAADAVRVMAELVAAGHRALSRAVAAAVPPELERPADADARVLIDLVVASPAHTALLAAHGAALAGDRARLPREGTGFSAGHAETDDGVTPDGSRPAGDDSGLTGETVESAQESAGLARGAVGPAQESAGLARGAAGPAQESAGLARGAAGPAQESAGLARGAAGTAQESAGLARGAAGPAQESAGLARGAAGTAQESAGLARGAAGTAQESAGLARGAAGTAQESAGLARGAAGTAQLSTGLARGAAGTTVGRRTGGVAEAAGSAAAAAGAEAGLAGGGLALAEAVTSRGFTDALAGEPAGVIAAVLTRACAAGTDDLVDEILDELARRPDPVRWMARLWHLDPEPAASAGHRPDLVDRYLGPVLGHRSPRQVAALIGELDAGDGGPIAARIVRMLLDDPGRRWVRPYVGHLLGDSPRAADLCGDWTGDRAELARAAAVDELRRMLPEPTPVHSWRPALSLRAAERPLWLVRLGDLDGGSLIGLSDRGVHCHSAPGPHSGPRIQQSGREFRIDYEQFADLAFAFAEEGRRIRIARSGSTYYWAADHAAGAEARAVTALLNAVATAVRAIYAVGLDEPLGAPGRSTAATAGHRLP
ncbi:hypothetical protein [Actinoplanes sp. NPDC026619]|uniref:hypothetical protein n=1 Tax=Actinoplanes sp. NPDC026619 TaxID=3155798 RepID=UPI0033E5675C